MSGYTPGPWRKRASLSSSSGWRVVNAGDHVIFTGLASDADARLIASAPDMLWALQEVLTEVEDCGLPEDMADSWDFIGKVRAVIAKATQP